MHHSLGSIHTRCQGCITLWEVYTLGVKDASLFGKYTHSVSRMHHSLGSIHTQCQGCITLWEVYTLGVKDASLFGKYTHSVSRMHHSLGSIHTRCHGCVTLGSKLAPTHELTCERAITLTSTSNLPPLTPHACGVGGRGHRRTARLHQCRFLRPQRPSTDC